MHRYLQNNICYLKSPISPWSRPRQATLFWAFFLSMTYIFILQKIVAWRDRLQLFCTFAVNLVKFSAPMSFNFFLCKIWVITNSKSAANITLWVYWMRNRRLLLTIFCTLFNQLATLTYSALIHPFIQISWNTLKLSAPPHCTSNIIISHVQHCLEFDLKIKRGHFKSYIDVKNNKMANQQRGLNICLFYINNHRICKSLKRLKWYMS